MRNLAAPPAANANSRRGSNAGIGYTLASPDFVRIQNLLLFSGIGYPLASPNQARYKGLISTPGVIKFSAWKRESDIPK